MTKKHGTWLSTAIRHGNETISLQSSLLKWAKTRDQPVRVIDRCLGAMCNPTCPEFLRFVDTAVDWGEVLNGIVLIVSLVLTVVCVAAKICFVVQFVLLARSRRHYLEKHKSLQVSVYEPGETITLIYSSPEISKHSQSCENLHEMSQENIKEHSRMNDKDGLSDDCTAKGYNAIFYRTVQYLRMVFPHKHSYNQMGKDDFCTDRVEPRGLEESYGIAPTKHGSDQGIGPASCNRSKKFCPQGIHNATLSFKQGEFIAIIGKHGAGKTTLLKLLSGRSTCGCKQEHVFVNGVGQMEIHDNYASKTGFLSQFTIPYYREVTVRQYLLLAVFMRMPRNMNNTAKYERVEQIILEMKLTSVADRIFGGSCKKKLTELQKRLLCLAVQLITRPLVIFLDEPITGLDSASSMEMLNILRRLCKNGYLVIITTQALPEHTAQLFNQLVLLSDKQVICNGEPARLSDYYNQVSEDKNEKPHKGLEDIISDIFQSKKIKDAIVEQKQSEKIGKDAVHPMKGEENILPAPRNSLDNGGLLTRLFVIECRASLSSTLGQTVYLSIMFSLFGLTAGIVYWQADKPLEIVTAYCGSSIPSLIFLSSVLLSRINKSLEIRRLESSENVGYSHEHVIQTFLSTSAACVLPVIAGSALTYFMVMTSYNLWRFFLVTVISLVLNQTWIAINMMVIYVTPSNACHAGLAIAILGGFSGGFIVTRDQMPIGYNLLFYINPQFYGYSAITKVLLLNVRLKCEYESTLNCISTDGNAVLARFCFDSINPYGHLVIMLCITVLSLLFSWLLCDARSSR